MRYRPPLDPLPATPCLMTLAQKPSQVPLLAGRFSLYTMNLNSKVAGNLGFPSRKETTAAIRSPSTQSDHDSNNPPKDIHISLSQLCKTILLQAAGLRTSQTQLVEGGVPHKPAHVLQLPTHTHPCPDAESLSFYRPSSWEHRHIHRPSEEPRGGQDGLSGRLMHLCSN